MLIPFCFRRSCGISGTTCAGQALPSVYSKAQHILAVTTPRIDTHYVVTEFGAVNLKGLSSTERAHALIALAHPQFRDALTASARELNLI